MLNDAFILQTFFWSRKATDGALLIKVFSSDDDIPVKFSLIILAHS